MDNKICQSCGMPIKSNSQLGKKKMKVLTMIIVNIVTRMENLLIK